MSKTATGINSSLLKSEEDWYEIYKIDPAKAMSNGYTIIGEDFSQERNLTEEDKKRILKSKRPKRFVNASEIEGREAPYLLKPYIVDENLTLLGGEQGTGKTNFLMLLMKALTSETVEQANNGEIVGEIMKVGRVIYLGLEDGNREIKSKMDKQEIPQDKVWLCEKPFDIFNDKIFWEDVEEINDLVLIIIDPLTSYMKGKDSNSADQIGEVLDFLVNKARELEITIQCVVHPPKKDINTKLLYRFAGSQRMTSAPRTANYLCYHPTDPNKRVLYPAKNNGEADPLPCILEFRENGLNWAGTDPAITEKMLRSTEKILRGAGEGKTVGGYLDTVIESYLKDNPLGIIGNATYIHTELSRFDRNFNVSVANLGRQLGSKDLQSRLRVMKHIVIEKKGVTNHKNRYEIRWELQTEDLFKNGNSEEENQ